MLPRMRNVRAFPPPIGRAGAALLVAAALMAPSAAATPLHGQRPGGVAAESRTMVAPAPVPLDTFSLENGLRVAVSEDPSAPVVAVSLWYRVGSGHEGPGERGFAHLFEHLLLPGTDALAPGEAGRLVAATGGSHRAVTDGDRVAFTYHIPAHRLELALWLEAQRMGRLSISEPVVDAVRRLAARERWLRLGGQPYGRARRVLDTLPGGYAPYAHPPWTVEDVTDATSREVAEFVTRHFVPANATLVVVGDVGVEEVRRRVERAFGGIPGGEPTAPLPAPAPGSGAGGPHRVEVDDPAAPTPLVHVAWAVPPARHADTESLELIVSLLDGEGGLLRRRLVDRGTAGSAGAVLRTREGPGLLVVAATPGTGSPVEELEAAVIGLVEDLRTDGPEAPDLGRARARWSAARLRSRLRVREKAEALQRLWLHHGDPFLINRGGGAAGADVPSAAEVGRVLREYLVPGRRVVVVTRPGTPGPGADGNGGDVP